MSLEAWLNEDKIKPHKTTPAEIAKLFQAIERDIKDASIGEVSEDVRYTAALRLATIVLYASGYRPSSGPGHHWITIRSLPYIMGRTAKSRSDYLNACRSKRNTVTYEQAFVTSEEDVIDLLEEVKAFREDVIIWLKQEYPSLIVPSTLGRDSEE